MKTVEEIYAVTKGPDKIDDIIAGKGAFSQKGFTETVKALANDKDFCVKVYNKDNEEVGKISIHDKILGDLKKTLEKAGYPQKSEEEILNNCDIFVDGIAEVIPYIVEQYIQQGKKFTLPPTSMYAASIYLVPVKAKQTARDISDPQTHEIIGRVEFTYDDHVKVGAKTDIANNLYEKIRFDPNGNILETNKK